ncbi:MFS transporter [Clostridium carnis]
MKNYYNLTTYIVFGVFSIINVFYFPYLNQEIGLTLSQVGVVVSIGALFSLLSQPILSNKFSKSKNKKRFILTYLIFVLIAIIGLTLINKTLAIVFAPIYGGILAPLAGVFEIYIEELCAKENLEFSNIRKWGSIGFGCIVLLGGVIVSKYGYRTLQLFAIFMIIIISIIILTKFVNFESDNNKAETVSIKSLFKNKTIILLTIVVFLTIGSYMGVDFAYSSYLLDITKDVEYANKIYSISIGVRVFIEFVAFMLVAKYLSNANSKLCLVVAFVVASLKMILFSTGILPLIVLGDQLHGIMYGLYLTFLFKYLRDVLEEHQVASSFAILAVLSSGGANFIYPSIYSLVQANLGYRWMYLVGFLLIVIGAYIAFNYLPNCKVIKLNKEKNSITT